MGNICHSGPVELPVSSSQPNAPPSKKPLTFGKDQSLKREDFMFSNVKEPSSVLVKLPGSINGQQFIVEDCSDCDIFLLDNCTSVQIDECVNCRILVGPCQASLFLRNCKQCTVICAVQQFRTRDCENVDVYLYSATEPIIETSKSMRFGCFPITYLSLQQQFDQAKFSVWSNKWSEIYNFNPDHGSWKPLPVQPDASPLGSAFQKHENGSVSLWKLPLTTAESLGFSGDPSQLVVPLTSGVCASKEDEIAIVVCFILPNQQLMLDFVASISQRTRLIRTCQMKLTAGQAKALFADGGGQQWIEKAAEAAKDSPGSIVMEFQGAECYSHASSMLEDERFCALARANAIFLSRDDAAARRMRELVFQVWKPKI